MPVAHKSIIVTGAGSGIGEGTARHLAALGALVTVNDINAEAGERVYRIAAPTAPPPTLVLPAGALAPVEAARAAWETGGLVLTLRTEDAPAAAAALSAPAAGLRIDLLDPAAGKRRADRRLPRAHP